MIIFSNPGLIDIRGITTFGVSAKEDAKSAIGFFGTGLKYAIAVTLRLGGRVEMWRGVRHFIFHTEAQTIRGKEFQFIIMDEFDEGSDKITHGMQLPFTTELGKQWEPWMAYREFHSNMLDEGGHVEQYSDIRTFGENDEDWTRFMVWGLDDEYHSRAKTFTEAAILWKNDHLEIRAGSSYYVYKKGVRVGAWGGGRESVYTYNLLKDEYGTHLTEDRTIKEPFYTNYMIGSHINKCDVQEIINQVIVCGSNYKDHDFKYSWVDKLSPQINTALRAVIGTPRESDANDSAVSIYKVHQPVVYDAYPMLTKLDHSKVKRALEHINWMGYEVNVEDICITDDLPDGILGTFKNNQIYISLRCVRDSVKMLTATIMEEWLHKTKKFEDCSREFQDFLLRQWLDESEQRRGEVL